MTSDMVTEIARRCGAVAVIDGREVWATVTGPVIKKLMLAAANAEREECAKLVAQMGGSDELACRLGRAMAQAIRARFNV